MAPALAQILPLVLLGLVFYFLILRPQRARAQQQQTLLNAIAAGDRVVTIGGFHGTVLAVDGDTVRLEVAPGTVATVAKAAIARRILDLAAGEVGATDAGSTVQD